MTVYVPIRNVGAIKPGQTVSLGVPSLPGKNYLARVSFISPNAEFKPANIYNSKERSEIVFAVRVTVQNPNNELKAGLPADVTFADQ
jgi:HlyD family secretion protein